MQIITIDNQDFPALLDQLRQAKAIGSYARDNGQVLVVYATDCFMLVAAEGTPAKIALRPARSIHESEELARAHLRREQERGSLITENG